MAFVLADRVRETTTTAGTGAVSLAGAVSGFQTFSTAIGNANNTYYTIADPAIYERFKTLSARFAQLKSLPS